MRHSSSLFVLSILLLLLLLPVISLTALAQQKPAPAAVPQTSAAGQTPAVQATAEEVLLDIIVRDKKGKPITDLKPEELTVLDNGSPQKILSFRLVQGAEAITHTGAKVTLDPLRQLRLVTLAFEAMDAPDQRKTARTAAIDLVNGDQGTNVFYAVVVINTRLAVVQEFTTDKAAIINAINRATAGQSAGTLVSESEKIKNDLRRHLNGMGVNGDTGDTATLAAAAMAANPAVTNGPPSDPTQAMLMKVMLDMLRMDQAMASFGTRLTISALQSLVQGLQAMPGRKSILYFTWGMYLSTELDVPFRNLMAMANRGNVTFYSLDTRGVMTYSQNAGAAAQLNAANNASATTVTRTSGAVTKEEMMASDSAETAGRNNVQLPIRDLAESTGGFLIGDSNDLRGPLRHVNEEISSYYELSYNPAITNYDGSFRKVKVDVDRKNLVIHARNGYFALPPEARASGLMPFEMPLLKAISEGKLSEDVEFRSAAVLLQPKSEAQDVTVLMEVPLHALQPKAAAGGVSLSVHFSLGALVKDAKGEVVQKLTRDRSLMVTPDQLKMGNFVEKMTIAVPAGKYTLESAVMDRESGKIGVGRSDFTIGPKGKGVGISSLTGVRSYNPNAKGLDPNEPFQFQGGAITPTLNTSVPRSPDAVLRLFFTVYQDPAIPASPTVEIEFLQGGTPLTRVPLPLPPADPQGRIPYVMSIPAAAIPPGNYEVRAIAKQGDTTSEARTMVRIAAF